jgi:hypothetical protein
MSRYDHPSHQVYMYFFQRGGWEVQFLEADLKGTATPEVDVHRPGKDPRAGQARGSLGNI